VPFIVFIGSRSYGGTEGAGGSWSWGATTNATETSGELEKAASVGRKSGAGKVFEKFKGGVVVMARQ
jgi:hypothetical protein